MSSENVKEIDNFVDLYKVLHSDEVQTKDIWWILKGIDYLSGQVEIHKYLLSNSTENNKNGINLNSTSNINSTSNDLVNSPQPSILQPSNFQPPFQNTSSPHLHPSHPYSSPSQSSSRFPPQKSQQSQKTQQAKPSKSSQKDVSNIPVIFEWDAYDLRKFRFWGCKIPTGNSPPPPVPI